MKARLGIVIVVLTATLVLAGVAQAHVTVHPNALPSGGFTVVNLQVPNERDKASTVKVEVQVPRGILFLSTQPVTGWSAKVTYAKLATPVKMFGSQITQQVDRVSFTSKGGKIGPGQFQSFPLSLLVPSAKAGTILSFKALQTYSNGEIVRWIGAPDGEAPAPRVLVTAKNSPVQDYPAGVEAAKSKVAKSVVVGLPLAALAVLGLAYARRRRA